MTEMNTIYDIVDPESETDFLFSQAASVSSVTIDKNGNKEWRVNGVLHRETDSPAVIKIATNESPGMQEWYQNGQRHRDNYLPAVISDDGTLLWYVNGELKAAHYPKKTKSMEQESFQHGIIAGVTLLTSTYLFALGSICIGVGIGLKYGHILKLN